MNKALIAMNLSMTDWLVIGYMFITGLWLIIYKNPMIINYRRHMLYRVLALIIIGMLAAFSQHFQIIQILHDWYPLLTILIFYAELDILAKLFHQDVLDEKIIMMEERLFKCQPSMRFSEYFPNKLFSEYLHFSYLVYYIILVGVPLYFYGSGNLEAFQYVVFAEIFVFYSCLMIYIFFPVAGPRYLFPQNENLLNGGPICRLTHKMLEKHSSKGTAFPSSHVAMASIVCFTAFYWNSTIGWLVFPFWIGITLGVIYCRFHYALDAVFGFMLAMMGFILIHWMLLV